MICEKRQVTLCLHASSHAILSALILAIFLHQAANAQGLGRKLFTSSELDSLAVKVNRVQTIYESFLLANRILCRGSFTHKEDARLQYDFYLDERPDPAFCSHFDDYNYWKDRFVVYMCADWTTTPTRQRAFVLGYDGSMFLLFGFEKQNINDLLHEKIGAVKSRDDALHFAKFYIACTFALGYANQVFIEESNRHSYDSLRKGLPLPDVRITKKSCRITLYSVEPSTGWVWQHDLTLSGNKLIKEKHKAVKKGLDRDVF